MPAYKNSPLETVQLLVSGRSAYLLGSYNNNVATTKLLVTNVALTSNVATYTVTLVEGNIPAVGSLLTVTGTQNNAGLFNITAVALTGVTITAATGIGTVTAALTHADVVSVAAAGVAAVAIPEVPEALVAGASIPVAVQFQNARAESGKSLKATISFPSLPTSVVVTLQDSILNVDSDFADIATVATVSGGVLSATGSVEVVATPGRFYRFKVGAVTGGSSPKIIGKIFA